MVASKLRKVGGIIRKAKEEIGEVGSSYAGEFITLGIDKSDYFAPGGGFWYTPLGQWLANASKGTIFEGGSYSEPYVAGAIAAGFFGLGTYLALKNGKYAMIADELEKKLDNNEITIDQAIDQILNKYKGNEEALRKIAKYTSYEEEIMNRYKKMKEEELGKIEDEKERLNYIWDNYNRKVRWWEVLVPFYNFYGAIKEYKAEKELYKEIAEMVEKKKISYDTVKERFGRRKAERIRRKYSGEEAAKKEGIFSRMKKGISGIWDSISERRRNYFVKSAGDSASKSDSSEGRKTTTGIKKRSAVRGILGRIGGVRGISGRFKNYFSRRSKESERPIDTSDYLDLTDEELYTVE